MARKQKAPATDTPAPAIEATATVEPAPAPVEVVAAPPKPKPPNVSPYGVVNPCHRLDGADVYLRTLASRVSAFERRLPDPADALSANEMERRANIKARTVRISRALSNAAGFITGKWRGVCHAVKHLATLEEVSLELQAKLAELYKVIPEDRYRPEMIYGGGPCSGNTITARKIAAVREALTYIDYLECPHCYAMLDESMPVIVEEIRAPIVRRNGNGNGNGFAGLTGGSTSEEAYAALEAIVPDAAGHDTYITEPRHLACPHCGTQLRQAVISNNSNVSALVECRPGVNWASEPSLYATEQWLDEVTAEMDQAIAGVESSTRFAESLESGTPEDDIAVEVPQVPDPNPAPKPEELKAAAYAALA